jgi:hypothetical protein
MSGLGALKGHEKQNAVIFPFYHFVVLNCTSTEVCACFRFLHGPCAQCGSEQKSRERQV